MPGPKKSKYGIQNLDFLGSKFKIGYSTLTGKFQTKVGGYLTILMGLLSTGFFFVVMSEYFSKDAPIVMASTKSGSRENSFNLYEGNLWLPIGMAKSTTIIPANQITRYVTIKAEVFSFHFKPQSKTHAYELFQHLSFDYKPCSEIDDPHMKAYVDSFVSVPGFRDAVSCPDFKVLHKEFNSAISYITYISQWANIKVYPCSLPDRSQCASAAEMSRLKVEYGYPSKLLKPADYKNPVESLPVRKAIYIDLRSTKNIKELVMLNKIFDDTLSLVPAKLKEEYTTLRHETVDLIERDHTHLYCTKGEVDRSFLGGCQEYLLFEYNPSEEVIVTTRSYKTLTAMLGEFGGVLKIITTAAFFVYGVYSMRKVKSVIGRVIFENDKGSEKELKDLVNRKKEIPNKVRKMDKVQGKGAMKATSNEDDFQKLVERFVSRRSNVDNLMKKLNLLELIEKAVFKEHEKALVPLVLLKAEQSELEEEKQEKEDHRSLGDVQIIEKDSNFARCQKNLKNKIINKKIDSSKLEEETQFSYQASFDSLVNSNPNSPFSRIIKEYMISQLQGTFSQNPDLNQGEEEGKKNQDYQKAKNIFIKNRPQQIELFGQDHDSDREEVKKVQSPEKKLVRKKKLGTGFMRPTNSPMRIRSRSTKKGTFKSSNTEGESFSINP